MAKRPKLLFISSIATPQQVKFCNALQDYFDAKFWFYEHPDRTRGAWWRVDLGPHCEVLDRVWFPKSGPLEARYWLRGLITKLNQLKEMIKKEIGAVLSISVKVTLVEPKTIERSMGKSKRVIDKRS